MLLLQVALESLGNLVGGGSGASKSSLVRAGLMNGTTEENAGGKEGVVLRQSPLHCVYPFISYFPFSRKVWVVCFHCSVNRSASVLFRKSLDIILV